MHSIKETIKKEPKVFKFDELEDDIRDVIIDDIIQYDTEIDNLSFKIARGQSYDKDGEIIFPKVEIIDVDKLTYEDKQKELKKVFEGG